MSVTCNRYVVTSEPFMEGDIELVDILNEYQKFEKGSIVSNKGLENLKHYKHCHTFIGYSARSIAGALCVLSDVNKWKMFYDGQVAKKREKYFA